MATAVRTLQNFIDGEPVEPAEGRREPVVNPAWRRPSPRLRSRPRPTSTAPWPPRAAFGGFAATTPGGDR